MLNCNRVLTALFSMALLAGGLNAQESVATLLSDFQSPDPNPRNLAAAEIREAFRANPHAYTDVDRASLLEGLRELAVGDNPSYVTTRAVSVIASLGTGLAGEPVAEASRLLVTIFETAHSIGVRGAALGALPKQADNEFALSYVASVVDVDTPPSFPVAPEIAVRILAESGAEGMAILRRINSIGAAVLKDEGARAALARIAHGGFRISG